MANQNPNQSQVPKRRLEQQCRPTGLVDQSVMVARARRLRRQQTYTERLLWGGLRGRRAEGFKFRRQHVIGDAIADFACPEVRLVVEVDGATHDAAWQRDVARTRRLERCGWTILRVDNKDVLESLEAVLWLIERTARELADRAQDGRSVSPLPRAGEGGRAAAG